MVNNRKKSANESRWCNQWKFLSLDNYNYGIYLIFFIADNCDQTVPPETTTSSVVEMVTTNSNVEDQLIAAGVFTTPSNGMPQSITILSENTLIYQ